MFKWYAAIFTGFIFIAYKPTLYSPYISNIIDKGSVPLDVSIILNGKIVTEKDWTTKNLLCLHWFQISIFENK